ncbi:MAG TPA: methyl-accepting chemotaxis protein [Thermomicrobiales bacterium]|nr:methyl-accepting chemotaxis protein [Thermomicrobiales bacterium]
MQLRTRNTRSSPTVSTDRPLEPRTQPSQATLRTPASGPEREQSVWTSPANISTEINGMAASLAEVDPRSSARLRDLGNALATERGRQRWSDVDLSRAFNTDRLSLVYAVRREGGYAPSSIEIADKIRNVLVLVPILLTWAALAEAALAYNRYIEANPEEAGTPFLLLWQRGFGGESSFLSPTFSTVAIIDAVVIVVMILLTFYTHGRREKQEDRISDTASAFQAEFDNVLAEATVILGGDRSDRPAQLSDSVERLADRFERSSQELLNQLQVEHDRLENLASRREREFSDFAKFASGMRSGAEEMHRLLVDLRQVSSGLETALEDLTGEVSAATDQQKSLLTAVSQLERMTSSSLQSDQAITRQLALAANSLSETADKAITGAESAAQAGRIASDSVRAIGEIARQIGQSQDRVEQTLAGDAQANGRLAEALRVTTAGTQSNTRALDDIGAGLNRIKEEFERLCTQTGQQANALSGLLAHQGEIAKDISQVARDMGSIGLTTAQRQREVSQDLQHLVQRLDGLATTLNRLIQQSPNTIRAERDRDAGPPAEEAESGNTRSVWGRSPRS